MGGWVGGWGGRIVGPGWRWVGAVGVMGRRFGRWLGLEDWRQGCVFAAENNQTMSYGGSSLWQPSSSALFTVGYNNIQSGFASGFTELGVVARCPASSVPFTSCLCGREIAGLCQASITQLYCVHKHALEALGLSELLTRPAGLCTGGLEHWGW